MFQIFKRNISNGKHLKPKCIFFNTFWGMLGFDFFFRFSKFQDFLVFNVGSNIQLVLYFTKNNLLKIDYK